MKKIFAIVLLTLLSHGAPRQQDSTATAGIEGTVVRVGTNEVLSKASVELVRVGAPGSLTTTTESDGRFYFPNIPQAPTACYRAATDTGTLSLDSGGWMGPDSR
jgi:hypothetical protein